MVGGEYIETILKKSKFIHKNVLSNIQITSDKRKVVQAEGISLTRRNPNERAKVRKRSLNE